MRDDGRVIVAVELQETRRLALAERMALDEFGTIGIDVAVLVLCHGDQHRQVARARMGHGGARLVRGDIVPEILPDIGGVGIVGQLIGAKPCADEDRALDRGAR
ncbi:hypothetical protein D9M72_622110 [compost metagenome]